LLTASYLSPGTRRRTEASVGTTRSTCRCRRPLAVARDWSVITAERDASCNGEAQTNRSRAWHRVAHRRRSVGRFSRALSRFLCRYRRTPVPARDVADWCSRPDRRTYFDTPGKACCSRQGPGGAAMPCHSYRAVRRGQHREGAKVSTAKTREWRRRHGAARPSVSSGVAARRRRRVSKNRRAAGVPVARRL
jgi:hypothetical protein